MCSELPLPFPVFLSSSTTGKPVDVNPKKIDIASFPPFIDSLYLSGSQVPFMSPERKLVGMNIGANTA